MNERGKERVGEILNLYLYSLDSCNNLSWARVKLGVSSWCSMSGRDSIIWVSH